MMLESVGGLNMAQAQTQRNSADVPISYGKYRELALKHDPAVARFMHGLSATTPSRNHVAQQPRTPPAPTAPATTTTTTAHDPNAMDVDHARRSETRHCYKCQKMGHIARSCPEKTSSLLRQLDSTGDLDVEELRHFLAERDGEKKQSVEEKDFANLQ